MKENIKEKISNLKNHNLKSTSGITLIALVITIIVLLILAGVSLSMVFSQNGIFSRAEKAGNKYNEAKAREVLETVLAGVGQYEKYSNPEYNQDDFLDDLIKKEIEGSDVKGDVAIVGDYAFELDRSVPKIGSYLGLAKDLVFPTVEITIGPTLINNGREATFTAKATEEAKGITRIELWLNGKRIEKETIAYDTPQTEIIKEFTVNKNGKYTIKAYADLMGSTRTTVEGIIPAVEFTPNGSSEWKKQHSTKVTVRETTERVTSLKYKWTTDGVTAPATDEFTQECTNNSTITAGDETMTGPYYLWVMLTTDSGKTNICGSDVFNFDNEGPSIIEFTTTKYSETGITLSAKAEDKESGIMEFEFYIDGDIKRKESLTDTVKSTTKEFTAKGISTGTHNCKIIVKDSAGNYSYMDKERHNKNVFMEYFFITIKCNCFLV